MEVVAALALCGLVLAGAARLLDQLGDSHARVAASDLEATRRANAMRLLRALVNRAEVSADTSRAFSGTDRLVELGTWCEAPAGWLERCRISLRLISEAGAQTLTVASDDAAPLVLWREAVSPREAPAEFRYLDGGTGDARWLRGWGPSVTMPAAIAVLIGRDTLVFRLGAGT